MFGTASILTVVTLTGLAAGFLREWQLVAGWGAGARTDAFLIAMFLPEALRTVLSGGLLSSAALSLWNDEPEQQRASWISGTTASIGIVAVALALALCVAAPLWIQVIGPGMSTEQHNTGVDTLQLLAWAIPGVVLHAWWSVPLQSEGRFLLPGFGSLLFNLPAIGYMAHAGSAASEQGIALGFVAGSVLMITTLIAPLVKLGLSGRLLRPAWQSTHALGAKMLPLAASAGAGQAMLLLERIVASFIGEGALTVINLARKLVNLPLVALASLNQVLLGLMSRQTGAQRLELLGRGLAFVTVSSLPTAITLILGSESIVAILFGGVSGQERIQPVLAWYFVAVTFAAWNAMIARFSYAAGDTRSPLICELTGSAVQALVLIPLSWWLGEQGIAVATLLGTLMTSHLLVLRHQLWGRMGTRSQTLVVVGALLFTGCLLPFIVHKTVLVQFSIAALAGGLSLLMLGAWLRPWRRVNALVGSSNLPSSTP